MRTATSLPTPSRSGANTAIAAILCLLYATSTASADWEYTRWNMSPAEVAAASKGKARQLTPAEAPVHATPPGSPERVMLIAAHKESGIDTLARFYFALGTRLTAVDLYLPKGSPHCDALKNAARAKFGAPSSERKSAIFDTVQWNAKGDVVMFRASGDGKDKSCRLAFSQKK